MRAQPAGEAINLYTRLQAQRVRSAEEGARVCGNELADQHGEADGKNRGAGEPRRHAAKLCVRIGARVLSGLVRPFAR